MKKAKGIVWDLSDLYPTSDDPKITHDIESAIDLSKSFKEKYHSKIANEDCSDDRLLEALIDYEQLIESAYRPYAMSNLLFNANGRSDTFKAMVAKVQDAMTQIKNETLFFGLEIQKISNAKIETFFSGGKLAHYRHYLETLRQFTPYTLSELEEQAINQKDLSGKTAFVNLFDEFTAAFEWEMEINGEKKTLTESEMRELARHQDPELRQRAKSSHDAKYGENALIFTSIFNSLVKDHATEMGMRKYASPIQPTHMGNGVTEEIVDTMRQVVSERYPLTQQYNRLKAKMLGLPKLRGSDLYAPVSKSDRVVPFEEGKQLVLDSFAGFSHEFGNIIGRALEEKWVDAEIRPGKRGGAFCYSIGPTVHPYVLMNYVDNVDSVYTMAHEFGHALHTVLACEEGSLLTFHAPLVLAETASVFAEMLLTRKLLAEEKDRQSRVQILASKLEDFFGTISRQNMYISFELDAHLEGAKRRLSADDLCRLWITRRDEMYGDSVDFLPEEKWFWSVIPHFIHNRFYCYAYTFGALLVLALFNQYEEEGDAFVPKYRGLLAAGDSDWPKNLIAEMGLDISDATFWKGGFKVIRNMLDELQELVGEKS